MTAAHQSILPASASAIERALEQVWAQRLHLIERDIANLWHPELCRADLLPYLAWALSVDEWVDSWAEPVKRQVIKDSIRIHKHKGTLGAVEQALNSVNVQTTITEWHQDNRLENGTFVVDALVTEQGIDLSLLSQLNNQVRRTKRYSQHHTIRPILSSQIDQSMALGTLTANMTTVEPYTLRELESEMADIHVLGTVTAFNAVVYPYEDNFQGEA